MALTKVTGQVIKNTTDVTVGVLTVTNTLAVGGTVSIGGTLTYEDVTNVDAVGLITARNGIVVGSGITLSKDGDVFATGITTVGSLKLGGSTITTLGAANLILSADSGGVVNVSDSFDCDGTATFDDDVSIADKIIHTGDTNTALRFPEADNFTVECAGNERFRVKPTNDIAVFTGSNSGTLTIRNDTSNEVQLHTGGSDALIFGTGGENERLRIDSSGRLLVATNSASAANSGADDLVIGNTSQGNNGMSIVTNNANIGGIFFADQDNAVRGGVRYQHASDLAQFYAGGNVVLNLKNKGVGINETSPTEDALVIRGGDTDDTPRLILKRHTDGAQSDGEIIGKIQFMSNEDNVDSGNHQPRAEIHGVTVSTSGAAKMDFYTVPNSTTTPLKRVTINQLGQVTIGTDTPSSNSAASKVTISDQSVLGNTGITLRSGTSGGSNTNEGSIFFSDATSGSGEYAGYIQYSHVNDHLRFATNTVERYRIHNAGLHSWNNTTFPYNEHFHFYAGTSGKAGLSIYFATDTDEPGLILRHGRSGANSGAYTGKLMQFRNSSGNENGSIASNASVTAYNTSSDYRLKENEVTISDAISKVKQLKPYTFNFKVTPDQKVDGFFAHEAQEVIPYAVFGEKDAEDMQQMDYGKLTPLLTAALQEAITEIESLKAEVAALKSS